MPSILNRVDIPKEPITVCMIVRDEERNLPRALRSVASWAREIVVVDTGSKDKTVDIAKQFTPLVIESKWEDSFAKARNESIKHATSEWLLFLDADEEVPPESVTPIRELIKGYASAARVTMRNFMPDGSCMMVGLTPYLRNGKYVVDFPAIRICRNLPGCMFEGDLHEMLDPWVKGSEMLVEHSHEIVFLHYGKMDPTFDAQKSSVRLEMAVAQAHAFPSTQNHFNAAQEACRAEKWETVIEQYNKASRLGDIPPQLHMTACYALVRLGKNDHAIEMLSEALDRDHHNCAALDLMGQAMFLKGDAETAESLFKAALARKLPLAAVHLYEMFTERGQREKADEALRMGAILCPHDKGIRERLDALNT